LSLQLKANASEIAIAVLAPHRLTMADR